jgi:uncharacterized small protein (DUF1192 family)
MKLQKSTPENTIGILLALAIAGGIWGWHELQQRKADAQKEIERTELAQQRKDEQKKAERAEARAREDAARLPHDEAISIYLETIRIADPDQILVTAVADIGVSDAVVVVVGQGWLSHSQQKQADNALQLWNLWSQVSEARTLQVLFETPAGQSLGRVAGSIETGPTVKLK